MSHKSTQMLYFLKEFYDLYHTSQGFDFIPLYYKKMLCRKR